MKKSYFLDLKRFLWTEGVKTAPEISKNIFPPGMFLHPTNCSPRAISCALAQRDIVTHRVAGEIYSWSRFTPLDKVRVVILGQDPYHNTGQAHGTLTESIPPGMQRLADLSNLSRTRLLS